jgi:hypothetical protein
MGVTTNCIGNLGCGPMCGTVPDMGTSGIVIEYRPRHCVTRFYADLVSVHAVAKCNKSSNWADHCGPDCPEPTKWSIQGR